MSVNIYFAVSEKMLQEQGMPERFQEAGTFNWELSETNCYRSIIADSPGKLFDWIKPYTKEPFVICRASVTDSDVAAAFSCALNGESNDFQVTVVEMTWIK